MADPASQSRLDAAPDAPLVLIVEDDPDLNATLSHLLAKEYRVAAAFDGQEGLEQARALRPDLIVADITMPRMDGAEMVRALRTCRELDGVPVLMLSGNPDNELPVKLLRDGVQDYVMKPCRVDELQARIGNLIRMKRAEAGRAERARLAVRRQVEAAKEAERRRIARDLHDRTGQNLAVLLLRLKALEESVAGRAAARERVGEVQDLTRQTAAEIYQIAQGLYPVALDDLGLQAVLPDQLAEWSELTGMQVGFHCGGLDRERPPAAVERTLYRAVWEALANVLQHAEARRVGVVLERIGEQVVLVVEDDGKGFDPEAVAHSSGGRARLGLRELEAEAAEVGGVFCVESAPGAGTTLIFRIPLSREARGET